MRDERSRIAVRSRHGHVAEAGDACAARPVSCSAHRDPGAVPATYAGDEAGWRGISIVWPGLCALALLYGSLLPLNIDWHAIRSSPWFGLGKIGWCGTTPEDAVTNVLVYVPLGMFLFLSRLGLGCRGFGIFLSLTLGVALSISAESLQTGIAERVASWTDVALNAVGTIAGVLGAAAGWTMAPFLARGLRRSCHANPFSAAIIVLTLGLVLYGLFPFDWVTSTSALHASFQRAMVGFPGPGLGSGSSLGYWAPGELTSAAWFGILGFLAVYAARRSGTEPDGAFATGIRHACVTAGLIEVLQVFTGSHAFDSGSLMLRWAAAAAGAWYAAFLVNLPSVRGEGQVGVGAIPQRVLAGAVVFQLAAILWRSLDVGGVGPSAMQPVTVHWLPFEAVWRLAGSQAAAEVASVIVVYGALAGTFAAWHTRLRTPRPWLAATVGVFAVACVCACVSAAVRGGAVDTTTPTIAILTAAVLGRVVRSPAFNRGIVAFTVASSRMPSPISPAQATTGR